MSSTVNDSVYFNCGINCEPVTDGIVLALTGQGPALPVIGNVVRIVKSVANGSMILKSRLTLEASGVIWVINDSAATVVIFCWQGENMNGTPNGSLSIGAGLAAVFIGVPVAVAKGGANNNNPTDWRSAVLS